MPVVLRRGTGAESADRTVPNGHAVKGWFDNHGHKWDGHDGNGYHSRRAAPSQNGRWLTSWLEQHASGSTRVGAGIKVRVLTGRVTADFQIEGVVVAGQIKSVIRDVAGGQ
jgi:hypothetical protein